MNFRAAKQQITTSPSTPNENNMNYTNMFVVLLFELSEVTQTSFLQQGYPGSKVAEWLCLGF